LNLPSAAKERALYFESFIGAVNFVSFLDTTFKSVSIDLLGLFSKSLTSAVFIPFLVCFYK